jgi:glycine cleavage system transcriptional repressor
MADWKMLTVIGRDQPGIVAAITQALLQRNANLGEAAMQRLGGNFTIMMMVDFPGSKQDLVAAVEKEVKQMNLQVHADDIDAHLHDHMDSNVRVIIHGADRAGIVAQATGLLAQAGMNILELRSDVAGTSDKPIYILEIEGYSEQSVDAIKQLLTGVDGLQTSVESIETMIA